MNNTGIHHVSVLSSNAENSFYFYHHILGMKLIMKTVNQDDTTMYHLFFGDEVGQAGTEFTVFEMKNFRKQVFGTDAIERTMFLVKNEEALYFWEKRLEQFNVCHYGIETYNDKKILRFEDEDGQRLGFVYRDYPLLNMQPYVADDIPEEYAILGLGDVYLRVRYVEATQQLLESFFGFSVYNKSFEQNSNITMMTFLENPFHHEVHLIEDRKNPKQILGVGGIHHLAFGVKSKVDLENLVKKLENRNITHSGIINRDFMNSIYFREPNHTLFEVATPLVEPRTYFPQQNLPFKEIELYLPTFLEKKREEIERNVNYVLQ